MGGKKKARSQQRKAKVEVAQKSATDAAYARALQEEDREFYRSTFSIPHDDNWAALLTHLYGMDNKQQPLLTPEQIVQWVPRTIQKCLEQKEEFGLDTFETVAEWTYVNNFGGRRYTGADTMGRWNGTSWDNGAFGDQDLIWTQAKTKPLLLIGMILTHYVIGEFGGQDQGVFGRLGKVTSLHFWTTIVTHLRNALGPIEDEEDTLVRFLQSIDEVRKALNQVCNTWAFFMEELLPGNLPGQFFRRCPIYNMPTQSFFDVVQSTRAMRGTPQAFDDRTLLWVGSLIRLQLQNAVAPILDGTHLLEARCWECKNVPLDLNTCSGCKVARYCSKKCQLAAWKKNKKKTAGEDKKKSAGCGHKHQCQMLCNKYDALQESIRHIDRVHDDNSLHPTTLLMKSSDYAVLVMLHGEPTLQENNSFFQDLQGPSMNFFFANMARIQQGDPWILPNISLQEKDNQVEEEEEAMWTMRTVYTKISRLLSYDWFTFVEERYATSDPVEVWKIVGSELPETSVYLQDVVRRIANGKLRKLSSDDFLAWYNISALETIVGFPLVDGPEWQSQRRIFIQQALLGLYALHNVHGTKKRVT